MILIDRILLTEDVITERFACDVAKCRGACCTFPSDLGAPLFDEEIADLQKCLPHLSEYLPAKSLKIIKSKGVAQGTPGNYSTTIINNADCVFVYYEGDIARCAIERAFLDGKIKYRKPISCHLFPIRINKYGGSYLYYQEFKECIYALEKGQEKDIPLYEWVKDALIRAYGKEWYVKLLGYIKAKEKEYVPDFGRVHETVS